MNATGKWESVRAQAWSFRWQSDFVAIFGGVILAYSQVHGALPDHPLDAFARGESTSEGTPLSLPLAPPAALVRGPYLQNAISNQITVCWRTDVASLGTVRYGLSAQALNEQANSDAVGTEHQATLQNLEPNTQYWYAIDAGAATLASGPGFNFITPPVGPKPTRIWAIGDAGTASLGSQAPAQVRDAYATFTEDRRTDVWLMLGDNAYPSGTDDQYQTAVFDVFQELLRTTPLWPALGNHETYSADVNGHFAYLDIFRLPESGEGGGVASGTERYYSFNYGDVHFVCLDSETSDKSPEGVMVSWLEQDLAANTQPWTIAYWHSPPYSRGSHNSDFESYLMLMRQNIVPVLENYGVDLVLCGHSHCYERSFLLHGHYGASGTLSPQMVVNGGSGREGEGGPYAKDQIQGLGTVYIVAGSSGQTSGGSLNHPAMYISLNRLGSLVLDISGNRLDAQFLRENGSVEDSFSIVKDLESPPRIVGHPISLSVFVGEDVEFSVVALGTPPVAYQWYVDNEVMDGEVGATLRISNVGLEHGGTYRVRVSNSFGEAWSQEAILTVNLEPECVPVPAGLVSWWRGEGDAFDDVSGNHGVLVNGASFAPGKVGQGFHLDGAGDFVRVPDSVSLRLTNELSFELWFRAETWGLGSGLLDKRKDPQGANFGLVVSTGTGVELFFDDPTVVGAGDIPGSLLEVSVYSPAPSLDAFHHLAGTFHQRNTNQVELLTYLDGNLVRTRVLSGNLARTLNDAPVVIGAAAGADDFFGGVIDEVSLYNRVLTPGEVAALYQAGRAGKCVEAMPPRIIHQPENKTLYPGGTLALEVRVAGTRPFQYEWRHNGQTINGATSPILIIAEMEEADSGQYQVFVSNPSGSVASDLATVTLLPAPRPPRIHSIAPGFGFVGTTVEIAGENFDPMPAGNVVHLGATRAEVTEAAPDLLKIQVPQGATFSPITVVAGELIGYSGQTFLPTFRGVPGFGAASFELVLVLPSDFPISVAVGDLNGDGLPELVTSSSGGGLVAVFRNRSEPGGLGPGSFDSPQFFPTGAGANRIALGDVDADGKLDVVTVNRLTDSNPSAEDTVSVLKNTSQDGTIAFASAVDWVVGQSPVEPAIADLDRDGRSDLCVLSYFGQVVTVFRNVGVSGVLDAQTFAPRVDFPVVGRPSGLVVRDLDGDARPDILVPNDFGDPVFVFRNLSVPGEFTTNSLAPKVDIPGGGHHLTVGDLNDDGKPELVFVYWQESRISVFQNRTGQGDFTAGSFGPRVDFPTEGPPYAVALADFDGDAKPDIVAPCGGVSRARVLRNVHIGSGDLDAGSFSNAVEVPTGANFGGLAVGDLDGDHRPEIITGDWWGHSLSLFKNQVPLVSPPVIVTQPTNQSVVVGQSATFSAMAESPLPPASEWYFNGSLLTGEGALTLVITNANLADAGDYWVVVANTAGKATSMVATLTVRVPLPGRFTFVGWSAGNGARIVLAGEPGVTYEIDVSENMEQWELLETISLFRESVQIIDSEAMLHRQRFYRVRPFVP